MSDFDFDEIDKAVNSALQTDTDASAAPVVQPEPVKTQAQEDISQEPPVEKADESSPPATRRSSGRFMDMVHPSSDMRSRTNGDASRNESTAFIPPSPIPETIASNEPTAPRPTLTPAEPVAPPRFEEPVSSEWNVPLETPFLPDAKVEKRPLGGYGTPPEQQLLDEPEDELKLEASDEPLLEAQTETTPNDFASQMSSMIEAHDKEMANSLTEESPLETEDSVVAEEQPVSEEIETEIVEVEPVVAPIEGTPTPAPVSPSPSPPKPTPELTGPTSIAQQYTEQPGVEQPQGAIYDTENYHQALVHTDKKRSGILPIIWILLLVIFGGAAGVGFYFFVLPLL
jgi:hypothetical protein